MELGNPKLPRGPFETPKGPGGDKDNSELSFRVPSIPSNAPIITAPSLSESESQRGYEVNGSSYADSWIGTSEHENKHERKPLCPPPLVCLDPQNNHSSDPSALNLATNGRNGSSTSTPVGTSKVPSKGGLIRPIPSRLGSPFSPILGSGMVLSTLSSNNIFSKNHDSSAVNPFSLQLLGNENSTPESKESTKNRSFQKLSLKPDFTTNAGSIEDYDSAFEDESFNQEEKESCSRTTPNNHKTIRKWRQLSHPGGVKSNSRSSSMSSDGLKFSDPSRTANGFSHPSPFQPISIRTSSTVINETTHTSIPSPFDIDVTNRLSPAGPLSAPSTFHWNNHAGNVSHHRPNSTGGSTSSSSGCSSFLGGGPFSPNDSLFASPGSNASSNGNVSSLQSLSSNSSSLFREHESSLEQEPHFHPFSNVLRRQSAQQQHKPPIFRRTTTTVLTKTETVTSPELSITEENSNKSPEPSSVDLSGVTNSKTGINLTTTSSNNIPVGIAVARQRTSTNTSSTTPSVERNVGYHSDSVTHSSANVTNNEQCVAQNLVKIASQQNNHAESLTNSAINNSIEKTSNCTTSTSDSILRSLQAASPYYSPWSHFPYIPSTSNTTSTTSDNLALQSAAAASTLAAQAAAFSPLGGYQIAKDPLTGQICFIPTPSPFNVHNQPHHMLWPPTAIAAGLHQLSSPSVVSGPPPIPHMQPTYPLGIHSHQHHSYLEQLQREAHILSTMARNYSNPSSLLSTIGFSSSDGSATQAEQPRRASDWKQSSCQSAGLDHSASDEKEINFSYKDSSFPQNKPERGHSVDQGALNDTKENNDFCPRNLVVKKDPCKEEKATKKDYKKFEMNENCQIDKNLHIKTKFELTYPHTKREIDCSSTRNNTELGSFDILSHTSAGDGRHSFENGAERLKQKDKSAVVCDSGADKHNNKCKMEQNPVIPGQGIDTHSVMCLKESIVKPEISFSSVKDEILNGKTSSFEDFVHDEDALRKNNPLNLIKVDTLNERLSGEAKDINEDTNTKTSHVVKKDYKSGLDILAEGVERVQKRKESSDDSINADSMLSSPNSNNHRPYGSLNSPLGMLYDAAILKADEMEQTTPIKNKRHEDISSEDAGFNPNVHAGRSRSLDGHTARRGSRRNSLCLSPDFGRGYRSPKAEQSVRAFIASKSKRCFGFSTSTVLEGIQDNTEKKPFNGVTTSGSLGTKDVLEGITVKSSGKPSTNIAYWENEMRSNLVDIQKKYKEKYKELYRLDHQLKRMEAKSKRRVSTGKECATENNSSLSTSKSPIPSPKKHHRIEDNSTKSTKYTPHSPSKSLPLPLHPDILDARLKEIKESNESKSNHEKGKLNGAPKSNEQLKTYSQLIHEQQNNVANAFRDTKQKRTGRIVPIPNIPRPSTLQGHLLGNTVSGNTTTTDLSTITSKFKVAKPNPFENLLKLSSKSGAKSMIGDGCTALSPVHEAESKVESVRNDKEVEVDPIEENVITPITHPITVNDVVDSNDDTLRNTNTINKGSDRSHYRKKMVETFILKKPKESLETKETGRTINANKLNPVTVETTKHRNMAIMHHAPIDNKMIHKGTNNSTKKEFATINSTVLSDKPIGRSETSHFAQVNLKSNLKLKLKPAVNKESPQNNIPKTNNQITTHHHSHGNDHSLKHKEEKKHVDDPKESEFIVNEMLETKHKKNKKDKKNKKSKKEKRENKSEKCERKKMKVMVERNKQNCMDISDQREHKSDRIERTSDMSDNDDFSDIYSPTEAAHSCIIKETDLEEGLRVLVKLDGHFYPGKILAISPPDIYGIIVDRERGNRPHIFSREEVLREAIFEVKPDSRLDLTKGTRVCAYWSEKYHHLFPGTISEDNDERKSGSSKKLKDQSYINIELDDGDDRAIHIKNIRFLPPDYPVVSCDNDPLASVSRRRRRQSIENFQRKDDGKSRSQRSSIEDVAVEERIALKRARYEMEKTEKSPLKTSPSKSTSEGKNGTGRLKFTFKATPSQQATTKKKEPASNVQFRKLQSPEYSSHDKQICDHPVVIHASRSKLTGKHIASRQNLLGKKASESNTDLQQDQSMGMAAFLPPQQLWRWSTKGHKRARGRILHREIERDEGETLAVGDCAIFLSTGRPDRPYVGRLESLWETSTGQMRVRVQWFYHASETEGTATGGRRVQNLKMPGALFESSHFDENDIQTISHRCEVLLFSAYAKKIESDPSRLEAIYENNDLYYLAGQHDPIEGTIQFENDVLATH